MSILNQVNVGMKNREESKNMKMPLVSRVIFCFVSIYLVVGGHIADLSSSHIFNPNWPPHAKFHNGQTLAFTIFLCVLTIFFAHRKTEAKTETLLATTAFASAYWITQALAILYPNTAFSDATSPSGQPHILGLPPQLLIDIIALALISIACYFASRKSAQWKEYK